MKRIFYLALALVSLVVVSCTESIDQSSRYVFKEETIIGYLQKHEQYSEYYRLTGEVPVSKMTKTTVQQLLSARGNYTVFAPTNEAVQQYLQSLVDKEIISEPSWDAFDDQNKLDSIRKIIVYNSIIDGGDDNGVYEFANFPITQNADFPLPNMNDRKLSVHYTDKPDSILISDSPIDQKNHDIQAINGVIHAMEKVVAPSNNSLSVLLKTMIDRNKGDFVVMAKLLDACDLLDTLDKIRDEVYELAYQTHMIPDNLDGFYTPEHRKYGFTIFAETDEFWATAIGKVANKITVDDVMAYLDENEVYPDAKRDQNYKSESNLLYQFVTYHMLPFRLSPGRLVNHYNENGFNINLGNPTIPIFEFYTTMGKRRLLKLYESKESDGVYLNRFPKLNNGRHGDYHELECEKKNEGIAVGTPNIEGENNVVNGFIYPIGQLLYYSDNTRNELQKGRIRWNVTAMWPEFMNNDIRLSPLTDDKHKNVYIPTDQDLGFQYLNDVVIDSETKFFYWTGRGNGWQNMQGDEMTIRGLYEVTMRLPPVPREGTYELRFGQQCGGVMRGMAQFYWGSNPAQLAAMGIPMDLRQGAKYRYTSQGNIPSDIGYEKDTNDDDFNAEVDKRMRNNGFMKGCQQYCAGGPGTADMMRSSEICLRRIMLRQTMSPDVTYYVKFKTVMDDPTRYFYMDYLEYCPKEVYDNPMDPEDIW